MIEVRNLSKHYGGRRAVQDISFSIAEGEIVGFLGPNGAGKTTTLRVLTCYHPATSGGATVAGYDVLTESKQVRRVLGYLPETTPLYPEMRVREYLHFRGKLHGLARAERGRAIERVTERCWLSEVIGRPIGQLSKGYRQRVGLADALLHNPKVLVLDEPTVGLDPTQIRETRGLIRGLAEDHTVLLSSHILPEVEATCERIIVIHRGRIVASGATSELRERVAEGARIVLECKAPAQEAHAALQQTPGVSDVRTEAVNGWTRVTLSTTGDAREAAAQAVISRGWALRELRRDAATLEEFFVRIVANADGVATTVSEPVEE